MKTVSDRSHAAQADDCRYDVAIIGGGLVGASLACALAPLGLRIALLEASAPRTGNPPSFDDRTLALSASSCRILEGIGVWSQLLGRATALREIRVTEHLRPGKVVLRASELGLDEFGFVVEAREFGAVMMQALEQLPQVHLLCPATLLALHVDEQCCKVRYRQGDAESSLTAQLVVGADGAESTVRQALGIEVERHDYGQTAIICNVSPEQAHAGRAFECFTAGGPFALLPHVNNRCGLVWSAERKQAAELLALDDDQFLQRAQQRFGDELGRWLKIGARSSYDLRLVRAKTDVADRAVILGNAAHAIHPIGAQGFNLGLRDVAVLAELLAGARGGDPAADLGEPGLLQAYSRWRQPDQDGTVAYSDGLARLFANPGSMMAGMRTAGLLAHALFPPLRRQLAIRAMGFRGRIPRLAMGESLLVTADDTAVPHG